MRPVSEDPTLFTRRTLIGLGAVALASTAVGLPRPERRLLQMNAYAPDAETPLDLLTTYITPNDLFFVRHHWNATAPERR